MDAPGDKPHDGQKSVISSSCSAVSGQSGREGKVFLGGPLSRLGSAVLVARGLMGRRRGSELMTPRIGSGPLVISGIFTPAFRRSDKPDRGSPYRARERESRSRRLLSHSAHDLQKSSTVF
jgi:hypothetical protein